MIATLPLVPFVIINLTRLTAGVCKVRFKYKVTRAFSLLAASRLVSRKTSGSRVKRVLNPMSSRIFYNYKQFTKEFYCLNQKNAYFQGGPNP